MLQVRNLTKTYQPKQGSPVKALDNVSLDFADKGLVFILGKSGSGKSTLLNTMGGLDSFDSGEIIIKGKSSKEFTGSDFDSYRNTFLGFIFQEYNILNDFNLMKNIQLALELQGKKGGKQTIETILKEVDLLGLEHRKVNELSGGQKQRVAIARALIKDPEIIFADEPTGALDSVTGIQVFDTLKKLSKHKLVVVVSHDREFAEKYGDRVIVMKDGKVQEDVTKSHKEPQKISENINLIDNKIVHIKSNKLSEKEQKAIAKILEVSDGEAIITLSRKDNKEIKKTLRFDDNSSSESFDPTPKDETLNNKYDKKDFHLIKSKLKKKNAFKMGVSSLKHKPIRLVFTILLSAVALALFGFSDTVSVYNKNQSILDSMKQSNEKNFSVVKVDRVDQGYGMYENDLFMTEEDVTSLKSTYPDFKFLPLYTLTGRYGSLNTDFFKYPSKLEDLAYYAGSYDSGLKMMGFIDEKTISDFGFSLLSGKLPTAADEVLITEYQFALFKAADFKFMNGTSKPIAAYSDIVWTSTNPTVVEVEGRTFKIVGVLETDFPFDSFEDLNRQSADIGSHNKSEALRLLLSNGVHNAIFFGSQFKDSLSSLIPTAADLEFQIETNWFRPNIINGIPSNNVILKSGATLGSLGSNDIIVDMQALLEILNIGWSSSYYAQRSGDEIIFYLATNGVSYSESFTAGQKTQFNNFIRSLLVDMPAFRVSQWIGGNETRHNFNIVGVVFDFDALFANLINDGDYTYFDNATAYFKSGRLSELFSIGTIVSCQSFLTGDSAKNKSLISAINAEAEGEGFKFQNQFTPIFDMFDGILKGLASVFLYVGIGFAAFAAVMMMSFIATSISYKKREIGILRALGARKVDVFRVFLYESLVICAINLAIAFIGIMLACFFVNMALGNALGFSMSILHFGFRQVALVVAVGLLVSVVASFFPVSRIARKKPIDAINNR